MNKTKRIVILTALVLTAGCTSVFVVSDHLTRGITVDPAAIQNVELQSVRDDVYIEFDANDCPTEATAVVPACNPPLGNSICRRGGDVVQFKALDDGSAGPAPEFGISFDNQTVFNPCTPGNLDVISSGTKVCNIKAKGNWPGAGDVDLIIKYSVITSNGADCQLDPYLVLKR